MSNVNAEGFLSRWVDRVGVACIRHCGCAAASLFLAVAISPARAAEQVASVLYDCGANALFVLGEVSEKHPTYEQCLEFLPLRDDGNSLLECQEAARKLGFSVEAVKLAPHELAGLRCPAIILETPDLAGRQSRIGHYFVIRPLSKGNIQVLDFPRPPKILAAADWAAYLRQIKAPQLTALVCGKPGQTLEDMLKPTSAVPGASSAPSMPEPTSAPTIGSTVLTLVQGMRSAPIATFEFGEAAEGSDVTHVFDVVNRTTKAVRIARLEGSCTCSQIICPSKVIQPGEKTSVTVVTSLAQRFAETMVSVGVYFDPQSGMPPGLMVMHGFARGRFVCVPSVLALGQCLPRSGPIVREVEIRPTKHARGARIGAVSSKSPAVKAELLSSEGGSAGSQRLRVTFDPKGVGGIVDTSVQLSVEGQSAFAAMLQLRAEVMTPVSFKPERMLVIGRNAQAGSPVVTLENRDGRPLRMTSVHVRDDDEPDKAQEASGITLKPVENAGKGPLQLRADFSPSSSATSGRFEVEISIDGQSQTQRFSIPFFFVP
jgi:hypothetical protein